MGESNLGCPSFKNLIVASPSPPKMKIIGNTISIISVLGSLICKRNFFLSKAERLVKNTFEAPVSCYSAIE